METNKSLSIVERVQGPTPPFFKKLRNAGLLLTAISGALLATPIGVPALLAKVAGYLAVAGAVVTAVSQATVETHSSEREKGGDSESV